MDLEYILRIYSISENTTIINSEIEIHHTVSYICIHNEGRLHLGRLAHYGIQYSFYDSWEFRTTLHTLASSAAFLHTLSSDFSPKSIRPTV